MSHAPSADHPGRRWRQRSLRMLPVLGLAVSFVALSAGPLLAKLDSKAYKAVLIKLDAALREGRPNMIAEAIRELGADDSSRAVKLVGKVLKTHWEPFEIYDAVEGFASQLQSKQAKSAFRKEALRAKPFQARIVMVDALSVARGPEEIETFLKATKDKEGKVGVAASRALAKIVSRASVDAMIEAMEYRDEKSMQDVVWQDLRNGLARILGPKLDMGIDYRNYLLSREAQFVEGEGLPGAREKYSKADAGGTVTLFGEPIRCKKVVIILDRSGSMVLKDPYPKGHKRGGAGTSSRDQQRASEHAWMKDPERERMFRAKAELKRALQGLAAVKAKVNVVAYSTDIDFWRPDGLHTMTGENLKSVTEFVDNLGADGVTATDTALLMAFEQIPDADCFYLISDGFVTHDGENKVPTVEILESVRDANRLRKVQINAFGFEGRSGNAKDGADRELMQGLCDQTGGTYTEIP